MQAKYLPNVPTVKCLEFRVFFDSVAFLDSYYFGYIILWRRFTRHVMCYQTNSVALHVFIFYTSIVFFLHCNRWYWFYKNVMKIKRNGSDGMFVDETKNTPTPRVTSKHMLPYTLYRRVRKSATPSGARLTLNRFRHGTRTKSIPNEWNMCCGGIRT